MSTTIEFVSVIAVASLSIVTAQLLLNPTQHNALMEVYNGLGCNDTICPRALSTDCSVGNLITLLCSGGKVIHLSVSTKHLTGTISSFIGLLTALTNLNLEINALTGPVPSQVGQLTAIHDLSLSGNRLTGAIPTQIARMTALTFFALPNNQFTGTASHSALPNNQLTGTIPPQIGQLTNLKNLYLYGNQLFGTIPAWSPTVGTCNLQSPDNDANCLDCSTAPTKCTCTNRICRPPTTTTTTATTTTTTTMQKTSTPITESMFGMSTLSSTTIQTVKSSTIATFSGETSSSTTTNVVGSTIDLPATQTSDDNTTALIGGIVGGIVALLLIAGAIAFIVMRNRKAKASQPTDGGHSLQASPLGNKYDRVPSITLNEYHDVNDVRATVVKH